MGGLSASMPLTSTTSFMASMSISGIPPFNGFFSKLIIIVAAFNGKFYLLGALAVVVSFITLGYFLKFQRFAFYNRPLEEPTKKIREAPFAMAFSMVVLALLCLGLSLLAFPSISNAILKPAIDVLMQSGLYTTTIIGF
jgi:multicomponent Na+:H+ antiporter subunit D